MAMRWITNNVVQGTPNSSRFSVVLQPNGQPVDGRDGTPRSPLLRGGLLGGGYGVTIDPRGTSGLGISAGVPVLLPVA